MITHKHACIMLALMRDKSRHLSNEARNARDQYINIYTVTLAVLVLRGILIDFEYRQAVETGKGKSAKLFGCTPLISMY